MHAPNVSFFLRTLGEATLYSVSEDGARSVRLRAGKQLALIVYLAISENRSATREHVVDLLWADVEPERGLRTLRQTVWQIRQNLGEDFLQAHDRELGLAAGIALDRDEFLRALQEKNFQLAVQTYRGPFLPDFGVPGGAEFEHWVDRERARLQSGYARAARAVIRSYLDASRFRDAIQEAHRLRDSDANNEANWRILLESLASADDRVALFMEAEALENLLSEANRQPEPATELAIRKARRDPKPEIHSVDERFLVPELVGREKEFAQLTRAWEIAKSGMFQHVHISAPAGIGKTRLLTAAHARIRARGGRVVSLRGRVAEKDSDYSLASDLVAALAELSGAAGIPSSAAAALIALNPGLSTRFAVDADVSEGGEAFRRRLLAVASTFAAVAEDGVFALLVDDIHWSDPLSRRLIQNLLPRITDLPVLVVTTSRPTSEGDLNFDKTAHILLEPLTEESVRTLVGSFANLPQADWGRRLLELIWTETDGSPFLVLEILRLALEKDVLVIQAGIWVCRDEDRLWSELTAGAALQRRIKKLEPRLLSLLETLAVAASPISTDVLRGALEGETRSLEMNLAVLEHHALAARFGAAWECSHDIVCEAVSREMTDGLRRDIHLKLGRALARHRGSRASLERAARHFRSAGSSEEMQSLFATYVAQRRTEVRRKSAAIIAEEMLGHTGSPAEIRMLLSALPLLRRLPVTAISIGSAALLLVLIAALGVPMLGPEGEQPVKLGLTVQPIAGNNEVILPAPVLEIQDASGTRVNGASDSITARLGSGAGRIQGTTTVRATNGTAVFRDLTLTDPRSKATIVFSARGLRSVESGWVNDSKYPAILRLVDGTINGQRITADRRRVSIERGTRLSVNLRLTYSSMWPSASVILGATPTWGDRKTDFVDLAPLATPAVNQPRRTSFELNGPARPGVYRIIVAFDAEGNVEDFMSGTNWTISQPIWHDGNDIVDWTPAQIAEANSFGRVSTTLVRINSATGKPWIEPHTVGATTIEVHAQ